MNTSVNTKSEQKHQAISNKVSNISAQFFRTCGGEQKQDFY